MLDVVGFFRATLSDDRRDVMDDGRLPEGESSSRIEAQLSLSYSVRRNGLNLVVLMTWSNRSSLAIKRQHLGQDRAYDSLRKITANLFFMTLRQAEHTMKRVENQKLQQRWPRRTIERGGLHDVQCRHPSLRTGFHDPQDAHQGKYEEEKRKGKEMGEDSGALYRSFAISQGAPQSVMEGSWCHVRNDPFSTCLRRTGWKRKYVSVYRWISTISTTDEKERAGEGL